MHDCLFCKMAHGELPVDKLYEDEHFFVIKDKYPKAPVHLLAIPHQHIASLNTTDHRHHDVLAHMLWKI